MDLKPIGDNFIPVIFVDERLHTPEHPFCSNPSCPCHEDREEVAGVNQLVQDGLLTSSEATNYVLGKQS